MHKLQHSHYLSSGSAAILKSKMAAIKDYWNPIFQVIFDLWNCYLVCKVLLNIHKYHKVKTELTIGVSIVIMANTI